MLKSVGAGKNKHSVEKEKDMKRHQNLFYEPQIILDQLPSGNQSKMSKDQLAFLAGLIKEHRPQKLVEIGVSEGGTTAVILQCISMLELGTKVISIDLRERVAADKSKKIGCAVEEYLNMKGHNFDYILHTGKYAAELLETMGGVLIS